MKIKWEKPKVKQDDKMSNKMEKPMEKPQTCRKKKGKNHGKGMKTPTKQGRSESPCLAHGLLNHLLQLAGLIVKPL